MKRLIFPILALLIILEGVYASSLSEFEPIKIGEVYTSEANKLSHYIDAYNYVLLENNGDNSRISSFMVGGDLKIVNWSYFFGCAQHYLQGILEANNPYSVFNTYVSMRCSWPSSVGRIAVGLDDNGEWIYTIEGIHPNHMGRYVGTYDNWYYFLRAVNTRIYKIPKYEGGSVTYIEEPISHEHGTAIDEDGYLYLIKGNNVKVIHVNYYPLTIDLVEEYTGILSTSGERVNYYLPNSGYSYYSNFPTGGAVYLDYNEDTNELIVEEVDMPLPSQSWTAKSPTIYDKDLNIMWKLFYNGYEYVFRLVDRETGEVFEKHFGPEYSEPNFFKDRTYFDGSKFALYNNDENKYEVYQIGYYLGNNGNNGSNENNNPISIINQISWTNEAILEEVFEVEYDQGYELFYYHDPYNYGFHSTSQECAGNDCYFRLNMVIDGNPYYLRPREQLHFVTLLDPNNEDSIVGVGPTKIYYGKELYSYHDGGWADTVEDFEVINDAIPLRYINDYGLGNDGEVSEWAVIGKKNGQNEYKIYRLRMYHYAGYYLDEYASASPNSYFVSVDWVNGYFVVKDEDTNQCLAYGFNPHGWSAGFNLIGTENCPNEGSWGNMYNLGELFTFGGKAHEQTLNGKARVYWIGAYNDLEYAEFELPSEDDWIPHSSTIYDPRTKMAFRIFVDPDDSLSEWDYVLKAKNLLTGVEVEERIPYFENGGIRTVNMIPTSNNPFSGKYVRIKEGNTTTVYKVNPLSFVPANILSLEIGELNEIPQVGDTIQIQLTLEEVYNETIFVEFFIDHVYQDTIVITENDGIRNNGIIYVTYEYEISEDWEAGTYEFQFYGENSVTRSVQVIEVPESEEIHLVNTTLYNQGDYGMYWEVTVEGDGIHHLQVKIDNGEEVTVYNGYVNLENEERTFAGTQTMNLEDGETYVLKVYLDGGLVGTQEFTYQEGTNIWEIINENENENEAGNDGSGSGWIGSGSGGSGSETGDTYQIAMNNFFGNPSWIILLLVISAGLGISAQIGVNPLTITGGLIFFVSMFGFISVGIGIGGLLIAVIPYVFNRGE